MHRRTGLGQRCDTEVEQLDDLTAVGARDEHVSRFDVVVNDATVMHAGQRLTKLLPQANGVLHRKPALIPKDIIERLTVEQLHHQERAHVLTRSRIHQRHHAGVPQRAQHFRLAHEAVADIPDVGGPCVKHLDRHGDAVGLLFCPKHRAHGAARDLLLQ